ncbi:hypothetical protein KGF56_004731 [Candida oxycetoniae]|uniref:Uncharacterized protein n=1 Tax=Candida oxycetoniae TaxID=497107 RepID=A0AAI9SSV5_9ASCO|nr:uncharacterized protein KGF56_004731 [Candida oxycetoniae]KAI3402490.2 hypothetical protein KGF56_004731 [Candida oxycetoniae]
MSHSGTPSPNSSRSILSSKPLNLPYGGTNSSPLGKNLLKTQFINRSPTKSIVKSASSSPKKSKSSTTSLLGFSIWEDKKAVSSTVEMTERPKSNKLNHNDQENILQPKKIKNLRSFKRKPLGDLSINEYKGFVTCGDDTTMSLTELYQPMNFDNESRSLHRFDGLPGFVTPSRRNNRNKYLSKSLSWGGEKGGLARQVNGGVGVGANGVYMIQKHSRSSSLGRNEAKRSLIKKNNFSILATTS